MIHSYRHCLLLFLIPATLYAGEPIPPKQIDFHRTSPTAWEGSWGTSGGRAYFI